ncbi:MAG: hypothetical protein KDA33_12365, partial [Phycisphaerales bacterium]|nr:hypothetical protein [Phycisphaerales bacterium]
MIDLASTRARLIVAAAVAVIITSVNVAAAQSGACCLNGMCTDVVGPLACTGPGGIYLGEGTACESDGYLCDFGACCTGEGCLQLLQIECDQAGGVFQTGAECGEGFCGACCTLEGQCIDSTSDQCANLDGATFFADQTCDSNPCGPPPTGACCDNGSCFDNILEDACVSGGRLWAGPNTTCNDEPFPCEAGACCVGTNCVFVIPSQCASQGGQFLGGPCASGACAPPSGACCSGTNCVVTIPENCTEELGRVYLGDGTTCEGDPCGEPMDPTGACCTESFGCLNDVTATQCALSNGIYAGNNTTCESGICDLGACCRGST